MAKAKKRRVSKELDKLWRNAKYWQWLRLVEQEGLVQAQAAQWQEAWRHLCRWALRLPGHLEEFQQHLAELKHLPDYPDLVLIRQLNDFLADKEVRPAMAALSGLSPAAQLFREKLLSWSWDSAQDKKIGRLLQILLKQPEKVTGRTFTELATLAAPNPLSETIRPLSKAINQVRKFNSKTAKGNRNWVGLEDGALKVLDNRLARLAGSLDPALRDVLLYPFIFQAVQHFERLVEREDFDELSHLAAMVPFLFTRAAGPQAESLKNRCRQLAGGIATEKEAVEYLAHALTQEFETKVAVLGKVRLALKSSDPSERLLREFSLFYLRLLAEIGKRRKTLSPRDKIELMRVMDPIIFSDLEWLPDHPDDVIFFLGKAINAGCGGALICTRTLLTPGSDQGLKRQAVACLQQLPYPGEKQIERVLADLDRPIFPDIRLVIPLLQLYPTEAGLRKLLFDCLLFDAKMFFLTNSMAVKYEKSANMSKRMMTVMHDAINTLRNDLKDFNNYEEYFVLQDLFECFSEGYLTDKGYHSLFLRIFNRQHRLDYLFSQLDTYFFSEDMLGQSEIFYTLGSEWLDRQEELLFDFVIEYSDDLNTAPFATIRQVVDRFCHPEFMAPKGLNFFLSLGNRLKGRIEAGDFAAEDLQNRIMSLLLEYRQTGKRSRRPRSR
ncbi:MAG: hypothetical protein M1438_11310 [Deltaproteobacteria bacterium]|nr:hypothetical protein [Deltaproteobacteria bacterium]